MADEGREFIKFAHLFLDIVNPKHGYFHHLPFPGSLVEQPAVTMAILRVFKAEWQEYTAEQQRKAQEGAKRGTRPKRRR
ncbi:hypothetical protein [Spirochaeta africana]|uniref:Uncharacterized protein n=1 Tax=Spirochaeta africana (strain ATCC 700263 / DSM 8902 / Z-7692) TaxID=889378 RepID=H9UJD5_SPIAZ|nr:hypothetical protein [Spirochaeta africana]AFG37628.1 hypothetical protein Spiaf_1569 [Spirochaeta africana DSM 8902]